MKDFIVIVLGMILVALALMSYLVAGFRHINKTDNCEKFEHISGIKTAIIDGTCYRFDNNMFVKVNFKELDKWVKIHKH